MIRNLETRILKLEHYRLPRRPYVVRVSNPRTQRDIEAIARARSHGHSFAVLPFKASSVADWCARYATQGSLQ